MSKETLTEIPVTQTMGQVSGTPIFHKIIFQYKV